jgi:hypothetical protein
MSRILSLLALFLVAFPIASIGTPVPVHAPVPAHAPVPVHVPVPVHAPIQLDIHRMGKKSNPIGGSFRESDWHIQGDTVNASHTKGLSFNTRHPGDPKRGQKVWSISDIHFVGHPDFKVSHDGKDKGGKHGPGHVSLHYVGAPIHKDELKTKLINLPWHTRSLSEDASQEYKRFVRAYRGNRLMNADRHTLETLD